MRLALPRWLSDSSFEGTAHRFSAALEEERFASSQRIGPLRLGVVGFFWTLHLVLGRFFGQAEWLGNLGALSGYLAGAVVLFATCRFSRLGAHLSGYALAAFDMPFVFVLQQSGLNGSSSPGGVAGLTVGIFAAMTVVSGLSLDKRQLFISAGAGMFLSLLLQLQTRITFTASLMAIVVLGTAATATHLGVQRLISVARAVIADAEERKQLQARLHLADRLACLGTLSASVAHEVNNPMGYVSSNLEFALSVLAELPPGTVPDDVHRALREALEGAGRVRRIVGDFKGLAHGGEPKRASVDVGRVVESCLSVARKEIQSRATLVTSLEGSHSVMADEGKLGQVFLNLLINAAQAIPKGAPPGHRVTASTRRMSTGHIVVSISDTGCGIAPHDLERLFEPFFTTKPRGEGTGLGLSIARDLVQEMGGTILVHSELGKGTTFEVFLPEEPEPPAPMRPRTEPSAQPFTAAA
jgi:signal transduction histidine kinase